MSVIFASYWWSLVIRGVAAVALGLIAVIRSGITLGELVLLFFAYTLFDGLVAIAGAVSAAEGRERWGALFSEGVAGIVTAIVAVAWPEITAWSLMYVIAAWALVTGVFEIAQATRLRRQIAGEWLLILSGTASLVLGCLMVALPLASPSRIALWIGGYAVIFGALILILGFRLRIREKRRAERPVRHRAVV